MFFPAAWLLGILATSSFAGYVDAQQRSKEPVENALKLFSAGYSLEIHQESEFRSADD